MASAGGPNMVEDGMVFYYDTGNRKSYGGEPTTNLWDSMLNTQSLRTHTKHFWDGKSWIQDATYTHPGVDGPAGVYLGLVFKHVSGALSNSWSGTSYGYMLRDIVCTNGATMTMSSWIYASTDCNVDAIPAVIEGESGGESTVAGYPASYDLNNKGTWQQTAKKAISDGNTRFIPLYPRKGGVTDGSFAGFFMWALPQVTYGDHVVQPIQPGETRSVSGSLLDMTGNSTIDLTNVSFDSNAQMEFDGTDDYIDLGDNSLFDFDNGIMTVEAIINFPSSWTAGSQYPNIISKGAVAGWDTDGWALFGFRDWGGGKSWGLGIRNGSTNRIVSRQNVAEDVYWHVVATLDGTTMRLYENGVQVNTNTQTINPASNNTSVRIGRDPSSNYFPGEVPYVKIYNRTLTAEQVKNNYNGIKKRFGI